jgi:hypothetical protein
VILVKTTCFLVESDWANAKMDKKRKNKVLYNFIKRRYTLKLPEKCI